MVVAEQNPQLMLYALGALEAFGSLYDITEVAVTIFQPSARTSRRGRAPWPS